MRHGIRLHKTRLRDIPYADLNRDLLLEQRSRLRTRQPASPRLCTNRLEQPINGRGGNHIQRTDRFWQQGAETGCVMGQLQRQRGLQPLAAKLIRSQPDGAQRFN